MNAKMNKVFGLCAVSFAMVAANFVNASAPSNANSAMQTPHHVKLIYIGRAPANKAG